MLNPYFLLGIGITILALVTGAFFEGEHIQATADTVAVDRLKIDAAAKLADANAKTLETERARDALKDELEKAHAIHQASIDADHARNRAAIDALPQPGTVGVWAGLSFAETPSPSEAMPAHVRVHDRAPPSP